MFRLPHSAVHFSVALTLCFAEWLPAQSHASPRVQAIRFWSFGDVTRIAIQTEGDYKLKSDQIESPPRLYFDLTGLRPPSARHHGLETIQVGDRRLKQIRIAEVSPGRTRVVFDLEGPVEVVSSELVNPDRLVIEIRPKGTSLPALSLSHSITGSKRVDLDTMSRAAVSSAASLPAPALPVPNRPPLEGIPVESPYTSMDASPDTPTDRSGDPSALSSPPPINTTPRIDSPTPGVTSVINSKTDHNRPPSPVATTSSQTRNPQRVFPAASPKLEARPRTGSLVSASSVTLNHGVGVATAAKRDSSGDRSLVRVFGLKLGKVVIDAGHGGHDTGTIGPHGLMEKDLVLDVALRLGKLISQQLGAEVVYTRSDDVFIPLEDRTKIANDEKADLFISIHANSSPEPSATGIETYYFNLTADKTALDLATRENATAVSSISDLNDLLHKAVLKTKSDESREFAQRVQASLWGTSVRMNNRSRDRGVRQAPFVVLIGATMPSILAEIGFVSNPHDEKLFNRTDQRAKIAEALFKGISQYANSLSHVQIARAVSQ
ncbi:MAG: N-acetylmuramoyl-L-alanine amidase [Bryobacteraceae bacterium]